LHRGPGPEQDTNGLGVTVPIVSAPCDKSKFRARRAFYLCTLLKHWLRIGTEDLGIGIDQEIPIKEGIGAFNLAQLAQDLDAGFWGQFVHAQSI
jgi:hypothetical protein